MVKLGTSPSRRRNKINFNSFYNTNLRNNRYLEKHPEARRSSWMAQSQSYVGETTAPRATLAPAISAPPLVTPTTAPSDLQKYYVIEETTTIDLAAQSFEEILNEAEDGEILGVEAVTSSPLVTIEVVIYGMGNSPCIINDYSINEMIERGRGLTPGDVELLPGGRGKDTAGTPLRYYPYVARYKPDTLADHLNKSREFYVFRYEPAIPMPYSSIIVNVKNTSTESNKTVDAVNIHRRVYENPYAENLVGTPIDSAELFKNIQVVEPIPEEPPIVVPPNTSPYYANWLANQQKLLQAANEPEIIPSEDI